MLLVTSQRERNKFFFFFLRLIVITECSVASLMNLSSTKDDLDLPSSAFATNRQQPEDLGTGPSWFNEILTFNDHVFVISFLSALQKNTEIILKAPLNLLFSRKK